MYVVCTLIKIKNIMDPNMEPWERQITTGQGLRMKKHHQEPHFVRPDSEAEIHWRISFRIPLYSSLKIRAQLFKANDIVS